MDKPLVTVVIATYNRAELLKFAIESVLWQTYKNFELWIVGDKCTDHTEEAVQPFLKDPRVNWYNLPENSGYQSKPNNEGIIRGKGKYIAYLNHDDLWLPNHLQDVIQHIEETQADFAFGIMQWVYSFKESRPDIPLLPHMPRPPEATAVIHRKDVVDRIGYWKGIHETYAYPRATYFRDGLNAGMKFVQVEALTSLKFLWDEKNYHDVGPQPTYMERIKNEPNYAHRELAAMLIRADYELGKPIVFQRKKRQWSDVMRGWFIKNKLDPARLKFWQKRGEQIRIWRKRHQLNSK